MLEVASGILMAFKLAGFVDLTWWGVLWPVVLQLAITIPLTVISDLVER